MILRWELLVLISLSQILKHVYAWEYKVGDTDVKFIEESGGYIKLSIDENNKVPINLLILTEVPKDPILRVLGNYGNLVQIEMEDNGDDSYTIVLKNKLDYENLNNNPLIPVQITTTDQKEKKSGFVLNVNNTNDNSPIIKSALCKMEENTEINILNTTCSFEIEDEDGNLQYMKFEVKDSSSITDPNDYNQESKLFAVGFSTPPDAKSKSATALLYLQPGKTLDFETVSLYIFNVLFTDQWTGDEIKFEIESRAVIDVDDLPDMPPRFTEIFSTKTFDEEQPQHFQIKAKDGDIKINAEIDYKLDSKYSFTHIDTNSGLLSVDPIDRDTLGDTFQFTVVAYEKENETSSAEQLITFIVQDIDDNCPIITTTEQKTNHIFNKLPYVLGDDGSKCPQRNRANPIRITFDENYSGRIPWTIEINDIDQGDNAKYEVTLDDTNKVGIGSAFQVIPSSGYQKSSFSLQIINSSKLDYEDENWRTLLFKIEATGTKDTEKNDFVNVDIQLNDLNDEPPIFQDTPYKVEVQETVKSGFQIIKVLATDRDQGDIVRYNILGTYYLDISSSGEVTTNTNNAFDYETVQEIIVQIQASDKDNTHQPVVPLKITVQDVNDETPILHLEPGAPIKENRNHHEQVAATITATDADAGCNLVFTIDWKKSYAVKNAQQLKQEDFDKVANGSITIETKRTNTHQFYAELYINEIVKGNTPDYEIYNYLYLHIDVTDTNQEENQDYDSGTLLISITDVNDNSPEFTKGTKAALYQVTENAPVNTPVGTILATDPDEGDKITYSIDSFEDPDTKTWISVDGESGALTVNNNAIDCDTPPRFELKFTVKATDKVGHTATLEISVSIIDQNDNAPSVTCKKEVELKETAVDGDLVDITISVTDIDRDEPYRTFSYKFEPISDYFQMDPETGDVKVRFIKDQFDRDHGDKFFDLEFYVTDNPKGEVKNQHKVGPNKFRVTLLDCNTQTPTITSSVITTVENLKTNQNVVQKIEAIDDDEGDNAKIMFELLDIIPEEGTKIPKLEISTDADYVTKTAILTVKEDLEGFYGAFQLTVKTTDFGNPPLSDTKTITLKVNKFNFKQPVIGFPEGKTYYLSSTQKTNLPLNFFNGTQMTAFNVLEDYPGKWKYNFELSYVNNTDKQVFFLTQNIRQQPQVNFEMNTEVDEDIQNRIYGLQLDATALKETETQTDEASYKAEPVIFSIQFYDMGDPPHFGQPTFTGNVLENDPDISVSIPQASLDVTIDVTIFYELKEESDKFKVDANDGTITLKDRNSPLDYETAKSHIVLVRAITGNEVYLKGPFGADDKLSILNVTIMVQDVNDEIPVFEYDQYTGAISDNKDTNYEIVKVNAIDKDEVDKGKLVYTIKGNIDRSHTKGTDNIQDVPFILDKQTGSLRLNFPVYNTMSGYFLLDIEVMDSEPECHTSITHVQVYIIARANLVQFDFENELDTVKQEEDMIKNVLEQELKYQPSIESLSFNKTTNCTEAKLYFIDDKNNILESSEILKKVTDIPTFNQLRKELLKYSLLLKNTATENPVENVENILKAWLIGVSVVLGTVCMILLIAFILKTRSLSTRIKNLTVHKYGSQESGLNRLGINAPTTNKHAIEGSNPVYTNDMDIKEKKEIDQLSFTSGDSDLIGVEDNPEFSYEGHQRF